MKSKLALPALIFVLCSSFGTSLPASEQKPVNRPPNIILILIDDMGAADVGCYRPRSSASSLPPTPHIDRLAAEGIQFTNYYSAAPICSPSRVGLMTGNVPGKWRITSFLADRKHNRTCEQADFLDASAPSVARELKAAGYATAHFGKWHMGGGRDVDNAPGIRQYGFDAYASTWESPDPDPLLTSTDWIWAKSDSVKRWNRTAYFVDKTLNFLKRNPDKPCYINLWPDDVHTPWVPDETTLNEFPKGTEKPREFKTVLAELDVQIGRLMAGLKDLGMDENTLVVFTSDNGALPTFQGSRSGLFRGSKLSLYEGGIRMPFIVRYPARTPKGRVDNQSVVSAVDLLPTFVSLAGKKGRSTGADGENRAGVLLGKPTARKTPLFWEYGRNTESFRYPAGRDKSPNLAMRQGHWKLLVNADGSGTELYDLATDPAEQKDVAAQHPKVVDEMRPKLVAWRNGLAKE
ncbi:sulfatase [Larkinella sp.]|uniref:sulfatase family protein n=1 Tax=Larkinella sp. TaxID=2034517 RepID=UPI003BA9FB3B